ncbi:hypothetical protein NC652_028603 [Populus alba x Populus x berolinensis]|uniref:Uncharacterized protein n=1 Tax=Populus alba x Populus x berolinensis TaxID=444605 RepID=A0AAD6M7W0_9ROSI|nr:hypothetical protein NC652_028603 [Populus alba x Populus x berolinensis]KAJ6980545.1 hypothetical protein NC653_028368 [Populus alba x Populus x berolinensis]KAJ6980549.1 hypothetical protein NC653_028372 [Populus alba x Populus x berolinensis]
MAQQKYTGKLITPEDERSSNAPMMSTSLTRLKRKALTFHAHSGLGLVLHVLPRLFKGLWNSLILAFLEVTR